MPECRLHRTEQKGRAKNPTTGTLAAGDNPTEGTRASGVARAVSQGLAYCGFLPQLEKRLKDVLQEEPTPNLMICWRFASFSLEFSPWCCLLSKSAYDGGRERNLRSSCQPLAD